MYGADAYAARAEAGHPGPLPRHVSSFRGDLSVSRRDGGRVEDEPCYAASRRAADRIVAAEHREVLRGPQGGSALLRARTARRVVHRAAARTVALTRQSAGERTVPPAKRQDHPAPRSARVVDDEGCVDVREGARNSAVAALRGGLH